MGFCSKHVSGDPRQPPEPLKCPRCASANTKFCYYNNYNKSQPRHFCKSCKRHWTHGGTLRNIPLGGGARRNHKRPRSKFISSNPSTSKHAPASAPAPPPTPNFPNNHRTMASILYQALIRSSSPLLPTTNFILPDQNPNPNPGPEFNELISSGLSSSTSTTTAAAAASLIPNCYQSQTWYDCSYGANLVDSMEESTITSVDHNHINPWSSPDYSSTTALELDHQLSSYWSCSWNEIDAALTSSADDLINVGWDDDDDDAKIKPLN